MPLTIDLMENPVFARLYDKGRSSEGRTMLQRLLTKRFGPLTTETETLLQTLTIEQIEDASLRILDATTLAEVFSSF